MIVVEGEQGSIDWHEARRGIPTASRAASLIQSDGKPSTAVEGYAEELAGELYRAHYVPTWGGSDDADRGHEAEPKGVRHYSARRDVDVQLLGLCLDDERRYGASPDGLVGADGLLECKTKKDVLHVKEVVKIRREGGACPPGFIAQARMQLLVTDRAWVDVLLYHPDFPSPIMRVERDAAIERTLLAQIERCILHRDEVLEQLREMATAQEAA